MGLKSGQPVQSSVRRGATKSDINQVHIHLLALLAKKACVRDLVGTSRTCTATCGENNSRYGPDSAHSVISFIIHDPPKALEVLWLGLPLTYLVTSHSTAGFLRTMVCAVASPAHTTFFDNLPTIPRACMHFPFQSQTNDKVRPRVDGHCVY